MISARVKPSACPSCGVVMDAATIVSRKAGGATPRPGDFSLCLYCLSFLRYGEGLELNGLGPDDYMDLAGDQRAFSVLVRARAVAASMPDRPRPEDRRRLER